MFSSHHVNRLTATAIPSRKPSRNLAARMGGWSAAHWKTATFGWLAFVALSVALGGIVGTERIDANAPGPGESGRMNQILDEAFEYQRFSEKRLLELLGHTPLEVIVGLHLGVVMAISWS